MQRKGKDIFIPGYILPTTSDISMDRSVTSLYKKRAIDEEDVLADVFNITNEVNKIGKCLDNPEVGLKDANRLLKEIDEQMEISFEIMEERQNMVRSYLIEREKEEKSHKNRADKIMADFANKMDKLDVITSQIPIKIPKIKASPQSYRNYDKLHKFSQTANISLIDGEIQTTAEYFEEKSLKEAVEALSAELQEVYSRQVVSKKKKIHTKLKKKDFDIEPLSFFKLESIILETDVNAKNFVEIFVNEEILNESNVEFKVEMEREKISLCEFFVNDDDHCLHIKNKDLLFKLKETKNIFKRKIQEKVYMSKLEDTKMNELRVSCRRLDAAEGIFSEKITNLASKFNLNIDALKNLSQQLAQSKEEQRKFCIERFITDLKIKDEISENLMLENHFKELCFLYEEIKHNEEELNNLLFLKFTDKNRETLRNCLVNIKNFLSEDHSSESDSGIENPVLGTCANLNGSTQSLNDSRDNIETLREKIGKNLVKDLLKPKFSTAKVCDVIHYQDKFIEDILQDYSDEIEKVEENFYQVSAINEVNKVLLLHHVTKESADALKCELIKASDELILVKALKENQKTQLETLKIKKDEKQTQNKEVLKSRNILRLNLKALNKTITGKLLAEKRSKTVSDVETNVFQLQKDIDSTTNVPKKDVLKRIEKNGFIAKNDISEELNRLKNDFNKLSFHLDFKDSEDCSLKKRESYNSSFDFNQVIQKVPSSIKVEKIIEQRQKLSEMLVKIENKIHNILNQSSKFTSISENSQVIENDSLNFAINNKLQLVQKLTGLEKELHDINYKISRSNKNNFSTSEAKKKLSAIKREMAVTRKKLREKRSQNQEKQMQDTKLVSVRNYSNEIIRDAMRELLQEKDSTENLILHLNKDLENLKKVDSKMTQYKTCEEKLISVEKDLLKKKEDCVIKMIAMAKEDHHHFIESLKAEIETTINSREKEFQKLTPLEKEKLRNELCDIICVMKETREQLKTIHQFQKTGHTKDNALLTTLSEKRKELTEELNNVNSTLDKELFSQTHENLVASKLIHKKEGILFQLEDLKERINNQEDVLKLRFKKLIEVKNELESKLFDGMDEDEFRLIISQIENPVNSEHKVATLFKEKKQVQDEITNLLGLSPLNKIALQEASKVHDNIDTLICTRLDEMMVNLHVDDFSDTNQNLRCTLLLNPELFFGIAQHKTDLENTLHIALPSTALNEDISDEILVLGAQEIRQLEDIKFILNDFLNRNIEPEHMADIIHLKSLNIEKMERLAEKIKTLTVVLDNQKLVTEVEEEKRLETKGTINKYIVSANKNNNQKDLLSNLQLTDISSLLFVRDDLLNSLFCVEKNIEKSCISTKEKQELCAEKTKLEKEIDEIDQKILNGDFVIPKDDLEFQLSSRSFSPKSTSSQASLSDFFTEREQHTKNLLSIKLKKNEAITDWALKTKDELKIDWDELSTKKDKIIIKKDFDAVSKEDFVDNDATLVIDNSKDCLEILSDHNREIELVHKMDVLTFNDQLKGDTISFEKTSSTSQGEVESEYLSSLSNADNEIFIENLMEQLRVLENDKKEMEDLIKTLKHQNHDNSQQIEKHGTPKLVNAEVNFQLKLEKCRLENEIESTRKKIEENETLVRKAEALTELEFLKIEQQFTLEEHKENKVSIELQIDIINSLIKNYACLINNEITHLQNIEQKLNDDVKGLSFINESADAFKCSKDHMEDFWKQTRNLKAEIKKPLEDLLKERQDLVSTLENIEKETKSVESSTELQEITKDIRELYKAYTETIKKEKYLQTKITVFEKKIADVLEEMQCDVNRNELCRKTMQNENEELYKIINSLKTENLTLEHELTNFKEQFLNIDKLKKEISKYKEEAEEGRNSALLLFNENNEVKAQLEMFRTHLEEHKEFKVKLQKDVEEQMDMNNCLLEENKIFKIELNYLTNLIQQEKEKTHPKNDATFQTNDYFTETEKQKIDDNEELLRVNKRLESKVKELEEYLRVMENKNESKNEEAEPKILTFEKSINNGEKNDKKTIIADMTVIAPDDHQIASDLVSKISEQNCLIKLVNQEKEELSEYLNQLEYDHARNLNLLDSTSAHLRELKKTLGLNLYKLLASDEENDGENENNRDTSKVGEYNGDKIIHNEKSTEQIEILLQQNSTLENLLQYLLLEVDRKTNELNLACEAKAFIEESSVKDCEKISKLTQENKMLNQSSFYLEEQLDSIRKKEKELCSEIERLRVDLQNSEQKNLGNLIEINKINEVQFRLQDALNEQISENKNLRNQICLTENAKIETILSRNEVALQTKNANDTMHRENAFYAMEEPKQNNVAMKTIDQNKLLALNESTNCVSIPLDGPSNFIHKDNLKIDDLNIKISEQNCFIKNLVQEKNQLSHHLNQLEDDRAVINTRLDFSSGLLRQLKQSLGWNLYQLLTKDKQIIKDKYIEQLEILLEQYSTVEDVLRFILIKIETRSDESIRISDLEAEIQLKNTKMNAVECSLFEAKDLIKNLEMSNETLEAHLMQLNDRIEHQNAKENDVYIKMIDGLEKQLRMVSETNVFLEESTARDHDKINQLNHENKMLTLSNIGSMEQVESLKKKEEDLYSDIQRMRNDIQCLGKKNLEAENKKNKITEEQVKLQEKLKEISEENKVLRNQISSVENADGSAKSIVRKLSVEMKKVKFELADSAADINSLTQENQQLKINNDNLCKKIQMLHKSKSDLQNRIDEQNKNLDALREEVLLLKESENAFKFELRDKNDIIEEKEREIAKLDKLVQDTEKQIEMVRQEFVEFKVTYQTLSSKHQDEFEKLKDELRFESSVAEEMKVEIQMLTRLKEESDTIEKNLKNQNAETRKEQLQRESELLINLEMEKKRNQELKDSLEDYLRKNVRQETKIVTLKEENDNLTEKINNLDEKYEEELTDLRRTMNESFNANIDNLNKKLRKMATDLIQLDQINESLKNESRKLTIENNELLSRLNTQNLMHNESQALDKAKIASLMSEIEGLRLENNDIKEKIDDMKLCLKKSESLNLREQELNEKEEVLKSACQQLEEEKSQFAETIEKQLKELQNEKNTQENKEKRNKEIIALKMLTSCQDQRDKLSEDLTKIKYELNNTKMELRRANLTIREKEQFYASEEKMLIKKYEEEMQSKIEEIKKNASNDKALLIKIQNEERVRWEEEMKLLSSDLHEENLRKLAEQKVDFEKELQDQIFKFLHDNSDEIADLIAKNEQLQNEKKNLEKQMDEEKLAMIQEHARQHFVWEDTVRRLLTSLIQLKEKQSTLRHKHQNEIIELENKMESEKERLELKYSQEVDFLKENLHNIYASTVNKEKQFLQSTLEQIVNEITVVKYGPIRMQPERDEPIKQKIENILVTADLDIFTDNSIDIASTGNLPKTSCNISEERNSEGYELKLRKESNYLLNRLLKLSDALEKLQQYNSKTMKK